MVGSKTAKSRHRFRMLTRPLRVVQPLTFNNQVWHGLYLSILTCRNTLAIVLLDFFQCAIDLIPLISVVVPKAKSRPTAVAGSEGFSPARLPAEFQGLGLAGSNPGASSSIDWAEQPIIMIKFCRSSETPYQELLRLLENWIPNRRKFHIPGGSMKNCSPG